MPAHAQYLHTRHFGSLDGLRFLCISAVIWHHVPLWLEWQEISIFFSRGHVGVDFFFVLSGFLITTLLLREEAAKGRFSLRGFYWRRALRIIPIYFFVVSLAAAYAILVNGRTDQIAILPYYYLFLSNFLVPEDIGFLAPTWSLAMEEQYYLVWPILLLAVPRHWIGPLLVGLIAVNVAGVLGAFTPLGITGFDLGPLHIAQSGTTYAPILLGSLAAVLLHNPGWFARLAPPLALKPAPWICLGALGLALAILPPILEGWPNLLVHGLMTLTLMSLVVREDNGMAPVLKLRPIERVGQISYGIYLYHLMALAVVSKAFEMLGLSGWGMVLVLYYALAIGIAEISFRTLEAWFLGFRHKGLGQVRAA
jgi:peptidoglycan/LPS O-acetylase OafA/YrhL